MRVKLAIHRHRLPAASVLWAIPDDQLNPGTTIAKLLSQIDEIIPLEADEWGLEDYVVEVDGFECMHFQAVGDVIKEGDLVTIRPLQTPEVRGRTLSGRYQISENGQHLIDGVPFGRPLLRKPNRPRIRIPPKKRPELLDGATFNQLAEESSLQQQLLSSEHNVHSVLDTSQLQVAKKRRLNGSRRVSFEPIYDAMPHGVGDEIDDEIDDEDDDDFRPDVEGSDSDASDEQFNDEAAQALDNGINRMEQEAEKIESILQAIEDEIEELDEQIGTRNHPPRRAAASDKRLILSPVQRRSKHVGTVVQGTSVGADATSEEDSSDAFDDEESTSDSESDSDSDSSVDTDSASSSSGEDSDSWSDSSSSSDDGDGPVQAADTGRLAAAKPQLRAGKDTALQSHQEDTTNDQITASAPGQGKLATQKRNARRRQTKKLKAVIADGTLPEGSTLNDLRALEIDSGVGVPGINSKASRLAEAIEFQQRREKLLASLSTGAVDSETLEPIIITESIVTDASKKRGLPAGDASFVSSPGGKRARLDIASTKRMIIGSLGVGRSGFQERTNTLPKSVTIPTLGDEAFEFDSDAWKGKIRLSAVECVDEDVRLVPPPYPFVQRWDPSQQLKKRKRHSESIGYHEEYFIYDEVPEVDAPMDAEQSELNTDVDLPDLPNDVEALPSLKLEDVTSGAIIVFKQLEMGEATNWQPIISAYRTALVLSESSTDMAFDIKLAHRDIPGKSANFDDSGNRILSRFEVDDGDDHSYTDRGERTVAFNELVTPKLLVPAPAALAVDSTPAFMDESALVVKKEISMGTDTNNETSQTLASGVSQSVVDAVGAAEADELLSEESVVDSADDPGTDA